MTPATFVTALAELRFENVFNPYSERCDVHDLDDAPAIRRRNLGLVLEAALSQGVESFWIARDLGYKGGRRTGLALTDEAHLGAHADIFGMPRLSRATRGQAVAERTASTIWNVLSDLERPIFLWNVFPLHPHGHNQPMTNRCHTRAERQACRPLLAWLLSAMKPRTIVAIGRDAQSALADLDIGAIAVRHPSYGGQTEFLKGVRDHYGIARSAPQNNQLSMFSDKHGNP